MMRKISNFEPLISTKKGFTLIELLIVIAVLGILVAVVLVALDPFEQLSRGRDSGRKTTTGQLGRALQNYYTAQTKYPTVAEFPNSSSNALVVTGEIRGIPPGSALSQGAVSCTGGSLIGTGAGGNIFCYKVDSPNNQAVIYTKVESKSELNKGACAGPWANVWYVYSTLDGRGGTVNTGGSTEPAPNTSYTYC